MRRRMVLAEFMTSGYEFVRQVLPQKSTTTLRWNGVSSSYLTVRDSHPVLPLLTAEDGARCVVRMIETDGGTLTSRVLVDGRVGEMTGEGSPFGTVRIPVVEELQDVLNLLGWQVPTSAITDQGGAEYARYSGTSEESAKAAIAANAARAGKPWTVAASLGRGLPRPVELRMHKLGDVLLPGLIADRLQLVMTRDPETNRWDIDVSEGQVFPRPLTPESGVLESWSWVLTPATATRAIVGGRGDGVERQFQLVVDSALEAALGTQMEIFVDARNAEEGADLTPYGLAALADHAAKAGVKAQLRETSWFQFPAAYDLGDRVPVKVGPLDVEDVITEIEITHDTTQGFRVVPTVGLATADPTQRLVGAVQTIAATVRRFERG